MKSRILVLGLLGGLILSVLVGCGSSRQHNRMETAYALLNQDPDSALRILNSIDYHSFSGSEKAYYALVYTIAQDKSGLDVSSDSLLQYAKAYYDEQSSDSLYAKYCYYLGKYYDLTEEQKEAEDYLHKSIHKAEIDVDYYTQYLAWNRLSKSLNASSPDRSILASKKAYSIYSDYCAGNTYNKVYLLISIGDSYSSTEFIDSSFYYYKEALALADSTKNNELISSSHQSLGLAYTNSHQFQQALAHIKKAWDTSVQKDEKLIFALARAYMNVDSIAQCALVIDPLCASSSAFTRYLAYKYKAYCALRMAGASSIEHLVDSAFVNFNKRHNDMLKDRSVYYDEKLQLQEENEQILTQKSKQQMLFLILVFLFVFFALIIFFYVRNKHLKRIQEIEKETLLHNANEERMLLIQKNSEFQIKLLRKYILSNLHYLERLQELRNSNETHIDIGEETWMEIEMFLNVSQNQFAERLHNSFPNLSIDDLRFCMLLRLDFSLKDLARVYNLAVPSVKQKQNKFKQKLGLDDSNVSLRQYLLSF